MYLIVCNLILNNGHACKVLRNFRTGSVKQYMPALLPLALLMLDPGHTISNRVSECFYGCPACDLVDLEESRSLRTLFTHSHLMPHESSTRALLGPSNSLGAVLVCVFNWYKRWHGLVLEPHGSALWFSPRALLNTSHNVFSHHWTLM